jgi:hypothetical protein
VLLEGPKKVEVTGFETGTARMVAHNLSDVAPSPVTQKAPDRQCSADENPKQAIVSWLLTPTGDCFYGGVYKPTAGQILTCKCQWWLLGGLTCTICHLSCWLLHRSQNNVLCIRVLPDFLNISCRLNDGLYVGFCTVTWMNDPMFRRNTLITSSGWLNLVHMVPLEPIRPHWICRKYLFPKWLNT